MALPEHLVSLPLDEPVWDRFFSVFPLVLVGTREEGGGYDLAPKHLAMPLSWGHWFGFVCTPRHRTYQNAVRTGAFTVSYPRPEQVVATSLAASPRCGEDPDKPGLVALPVFPAQVVDGVLVRGCHLYLECRLDRTLDDLDENSLLVGRVVGVHVHAKALRAADQEDNELVHADPLLAYLYPARFTVIDRSQGFPLPAGFRR